MGTPQPPPTDPQCDDELDLTNIGKDLLLMKVPQYIAQKWSVAPGDMDVANFKIIRQPGQRAQVQLSLTEELLELEDDGIPIPKEHRMIWSSIQSQCLGVFSEVVDTSDSETKPGKMFMEGKITSKLECVPCVDDQYFKIRSKLLIQKAKPRTVQPVYRHVPCVKPVSNHKHDMLYEKQKKEEGKRVRKDKESILKILYSAFEKHQYNNIKDLQKITKQPMKYLREILREVCNYHTKCPHRYMWELKDKYKKIACAGEKEAMCSSDSD